MNQSPAVTLVIPAHNEEPCIAATLADAVAALSTISRDFEIIVVDDGSTDRTARVVESLCEEDRRIRLIRMQEQGGKGAALAAGFHAAASGTLAFIDADGQVPADALNPALQAHASSSLGVIVGARTGRRESAGRRTVSALYRVLTGVLLGVWVADVGCPLKVLPASLAHPAFATRGWTIDAELLARAHARGLPIRELPVSVAESARADSKVAAGDAARSALALVALAWRTRRGTRA